jgi:bifunctional DNase/RNase
MIKFHLSYNMQLHLLLQRVKIDLEVWMGKMVEVVIDSLRVSLTNAQRVLILHAKKEDRYLPIWIGPYEAEAITIILQEVEVSRPLTHDLLKNVFSSLHAQLIQVQIFSLMDNVFFGKIVAEVGDEIIEIDSRPSDAIALAIRAHIPIMVDIDVLEQAGIKPEPASLDEDPGYTGKTDKPPLDQPAEKRLSIFEDFISKLDLDEGPDSDTDDSDDDPDDNPKKDN